MKSREDILQQLVKRMEDNVRHSVKAVLDSSLGQLGSVGVVAVKDFMAKMKSVFREVMAYQSQMPTGSSRRSRNWAARTRFSNVGGGS